MLEENRRIQQQLEDAQNLTMLEVTKIKADAEDLRTQLGEAEANYDLMRSECAKEIRRLSIQRNERGRQQGKETGSPYNKLRARSSNLELELAEMREKFRKSAARAKYEAEVECCATQTQSRLESELTCNMKTEFYRSYCMVWKARNIKLLCFDVFSSP